MISSIFVNPTQFSSKDTDGGVSRYPRTLEADLALLNQNQVDMAFVPKEDTMYEAKTHWSLYYICIYYLTICSMYVDPVGFNTTAEGLARPEFFRGVATILVKLFNIVGPNTVYLGQKDAVQCILARRLVADFNYDINVQVIDTIREPNGLAMSTRNQYLSPDEFTAASIVYKGLKAGKEAFSMNPNLSVHELKSVIRSVYDRESIITNVQYISITGRDTIDGKLEKGSVVSVAVILNHVHRSIDNIVL